MEFFVTVLQTFGGGGGGGGVHPHSLTTAESCLPPQALSIASALSPLPLLVLFSKCFQISSVSEEEGRGGGFTLRYVRILVYR